MPYRSAERRRRWLGRLMLPYGAAIVVMMLSGGGPLGWAAIALALLLAPAVTTVYLMWQFRVAQNCASLGLLNRRWPAGWQLTYWFIPVVNWVLPLLALVEIWDFSHGGTVSRRPVYWWWAAFCLMLVAGHLLDLAADLETSLWLSVLETLTGLLGAAAAALCYWVAKSVTDAQERLAQSGSDAVIPVG